jgi:hypothetical protein
VDVNCPRCRRLLYRSSVPNEPPREMRCRSTECTKNGSPIVRFRVAGGKAISL